MSDRTRSGASRSIAWLERGAGWLAVLVGFAAFEVAQTIVERHWDRGVRQRIDLVVVGAIVVGFGLRGVLRRTRNR